MWEAVPSCADTGWPCAVQSVVGGAGEGCGCEGHRRQYVWKKKFVTIDKASALESVRASLGVAPSSACCSLCTSVRGGACSGTPTS
eukprot:350463-Chlamydomonas_euryale.AAC.2